MKTTTGLSIIEKGTNIASNVASVGTQLSDFRCTRDTRRAGKKFVYAIGTIGTARQLVRALDFDEEDVPRLNSLFNAFTYKATEDILKG